MDSNKLMWFPDSRPGYAIGRLVDISSHEVSLQPVAQPSARGAHFEPAPEELRGQVLQFAYKSVYPCDQPYLSRLPGSGSSKASGRPADATEAPDVEDNCALVELNEAALLENVRLRFHRDKIYTYVAHILIAVNPYVEIKGLHSPEAIASYQGKSLGTMPPHVFAIADKAYRDMKAFKQSQSIIINGESGAGKTESQKYVLRYLCLSGGQSGRLEKLILDANPLLEAFGNAKTIRNNNSSRFGKFIEIHYSPQFIVSGGQVFHYLLEKSRICGQAQGERNYHIFYQLCACLPDDQWRQLELGPPDQFQYLASGCTQYFCSAESAEASLADERKSKTQLDGGAIRDQLMDERRCWEQTERALDNFGVGVEARRDIYRVVAAVLHLGNVSFQEDAEDRGGGCRVEAGRAERALATTARLMGLDPELLRQSLVSRLMSTGRGGHKGTVYMVQLSRQQAQAARDALAKAIYARLFDHIVTRIVNAAIPNSSASSSATAYSIGVLDVAGFEYFQENGFEQFLINFCNEKLQQFFNERILREEQSIYAAEGLQVRQVDFVDNQDCLQLLEARSSGIFELLDEEARLPRPSAEHFTQSVHERNRGHFRLAVPRASKLRSHREIRDHEGFLVRHFAGAVCYQTHQFLDKNNDALHASLRNLMLEAQAGLLRRLFAADEPPATSNQTTPLVREAAQAGPPTTGNKLNFVSVGTAFRSQLNDLMGKLRSTGSHFIRCVKPNGEMEARKFEGGQILSQLHCSGMGSVLELMQQGFPSRASFHDLYQAYRNLLPERLARLEPHLFCRALFKALGLRDQDFCFGSSKVFFRPGKFAEFDQVVRQDAAHLEQLVQQVDRWLIRWRWRKAQFCCLSAVKLQNKILYRRHLVVGLQQHWRRALVARHIKPRLQALRRLRQIEASLRDFEQIAAEELKPSQAGNNKSAGEIEEQTRLLKTETEELGETLKRELRAVIAASEQKPANWDEARLERLATKRDLLVRSIKDKLREQRELEELERRVAAEGRRRAQEEAGKAREAELRRQRAELEQRRQEELQAAVVESNQTRQPAKGKPEPTSASATAAAAQLETDQERRDYEIALRLAKRPNSVERRPPSELGSGSSQASGGGKLDLSRWKYSDLRDTINTSCDLELLEACKREFHRRLKVYHAWRAANSPAPAARAPPSLLEGACAAEEPAAASTQTGGQTSPNEQRYFRIPFVKTASGGRRGWWFAHFDGQWIARQLELHPDRAPILLVAGQHDIEMCELSLRETRLTSKRGAEILPQEFEEEWARHGGGPAPGRAGKAAAAGKAGAANGAASAASAAAAHAHPGRRLAV